MSTIRVFCIVNTWFEETTFYINNEDILMTDLQKDILTGAIFLTGIVGFISGEFILSSTLFASAAIASSLNVSRKSTKAEQF